LVLEVEIGEDIPVIQSDRIKIRQILGNLLSNAAKYTESGRISIVVELRPSGTEGEAAGWVEASVADTGTGIAQEDHELVFKEFARLDPEKTQGVGLGLAISQWIAEKLGARIMLESSLGEGSTFTLCLPLEWEGPAVELASSSEPAAAAL
jgi:signal transduction histidine kinase